ncbi:hypothetical protein BDV06DRAFT_195735 [Aspergillus oleicola]
MVRTFKLADSRSMKTQTGWILMAWGSFRIAGIFRRRMIRRMLRRKGEKIKAG